MKRQNAKTPADGIWKEGRDLARPRFRGLHRGASMGQRPKRYSREFAKRAIRLCEEHADRPLSEVARDLGVGYATLYSWMKRAGKTKRRTPGPPSVAGPGAQTP